MIQPRVVVVGASMGGLAALKTILGGLPAEFAIPLAIVQHRGKWSDDGFCAILAAVCPFAVEEANDKDELRVGRVAIAPPGYHLMVDRDGLVLSTDPPVHHSRPSIDVLFESAAHVFGACAAGVILTGSTEDGAAGAAAIKRAGGLVVVEDPRTAEVAAMPAAALEATQADRVLPVGEIAPFLASLGAQGGR